MPSATRESLNMVAHWFFQQCCHWQKTSRTYDILSPALYQQRKRSSCAPSTSMTRDAGSIFDLLNDSLNLPEFESKLLSTDCHKYSSPACLGYQPSGCPSIPFFSASFYKDFQSQTCHPRIHHCKVVSPQPLQPTQLQCESITTMPSHTLPTPSVILRPPLETMRFHPFPPEPIDSVDCCSATPKNAFTQECNNRDCPSHLPLPAATTVLVPTLTIDDHLEIIFARVLQTCPSGNGGFVCGRTTTITATYNKTQPATPTSIDPPTPT